MKARKPPKSRPKALHHKSEDEKHRFWTHLKSATPVILLISAATLIATQFGWLTGLGSSSLDLFLKITEPAAPKYVWLIAITDRDYEKLFKRKSPLNGRVLARVIQVTAKGQPSVIGVDVNTSKSKIVFAPELLKSPASNPGEPAVPWPPIIWAQNAKQEGDELRPQPVLDGVDPQPLTALGFFLRDANDRVVRRYRRMIPTTEGEKASLPWALVKVFCSREPHAGDPALADVRKRISDPASQREEWPLILGFSQTRHLNTRVIPAEDLLAQENSPGWVTNSPIKDQIALIGGVFSESADQYDTNVGQFFGVELIAQAIEAELQMKTVRPLNEVFMLLVDICGGFILVVWRFFAPAWLGFTLRALAVPLLAVGSSWFVFLSAAHWANFAPVLLGVLLHECYDHWREYRELRTRAEGHS